MPRDVAARGGVLEYYLRAVPGVVDVKVFDRTQDAVVSYQDCRAAVVQALAAFSFQRAEARSLCRSTHPAR